MFIQLAANVDLLLVFEGRRLTVLAHQSIPFLLIRTRSRYVLCKERDADTRRRNTSDPDLYDPVRTTSSEPISTAVFRLSEFCLRIQTFRRQKLKNVSESTYILLLVWAAWGATYQDESLAATPLATSGVADHWP